MVNLETAVTDGTCPEPQNKPYIFDAPASAVTALKSATVSVATEANDHGMDCGAQGLSQNLTIAAQANYPIIGIGNTAAQAFAPYRVTDQRPTRRDHHGDAGDRRQPRRHVDGVVDPTGRGLGDRPDTAGARGPAGAAHGRHRDRLRALGHRDAGLPEPAAGAAGAAARQGGGRHRHRLRHPRPPGRRLSRRRLRRLRPRQPRLLRQHRPRDRQRDPRPHRAGPPHHGRRLAPRHHPQRRAPAPDGRPGHDGGRRAGTPPAVAPTCRRRPSATLTTMRGETVPFVAPPAAPTTTTTTTSSGSSGGRTTTTTTTAPTSGGSTTTTTSSAPPRQHHHDDDHPASTTTQATDNAAASATGPAALSAGRSSATAFR